MKHQKSWFVLCFLIVSQFLFLASYLYGQDPFIIKDPYPGDKYTSNGVSWGDWNNDGFDDVFIGNGAQNYKFEDFLYSNNGDGTFTKITGQDIVTEIHLTGGACWGDFDNDGDLDIYVTINEDSPFGTDLQNILYINDSGTFTKSTIAGPPITESEYSNTAGWGDYDNDGFMDLFVKNGWQGAKKEHSLYHNEGDGTFTEIDAGDMTGSNGSAFISGFAWCDYDNDGDLDVFTCGGSGPNNHLWRNDGGGTFTEVGSFDGSTSNGCSWADYDNDGDFDLFISNYADGDVKEKNDLYQNNGDGTFTKLTSILIASEESYSMGSAWGDIDNDGDLDLFVANDYEYDTNPNFLYINNGDGTFTKNTTSVAVTDPSSQAPHGVAFADYNNNGFLDLFAAVHGPNFFLENVEPDNGNTNHWIEVKLIGSPSNRTAIGAKLWLTTTIFGNSVTQLREISTQTGMGSHNSLRAHFGLGDATTISELRIEWPSGTTQIRNNVSVDQILTITEGVDPAEITVTSPNGGEDWLVGSSQDITWTSTGTSGNVMIEYSTDSGSNWTEIVASTTDNGSYSWTIPDDPSTTCLVKVTDTDGDPSDESDAVFTISPSSFNISGTVSYYNESRPVSDAIIDLTHPQGSLQDTTDSNGDYLFENIESGSVEVTPSKEDDLRDAITGSDALLVLQYLAFLATMTDDQQFAADVTEDGSVTGSDAQAILRYLAFYTDNIASTGQWRFDPASASFTLSADAVANFKAFLLGDATGDWGSSSSSMAKNKTTDIALKIGQVDVRPAQPLQIPVRIENVSEPLHTLLFTISYDASKLRYRSTEKTWLSDHFLFAANGEESGKVHVAMAGVKGAARAGEMLHLIFDVIDPGQTTGTSKIEITRAIINDMKVVFVTTGVVNFGGESGIPERYGLSQNYPNPFNPETMISYQIPAAGHVDLRIYNLAGNEIVRLVDGEKEAGTYRVKWDGKNALGEQVSSGLYIIKFVSGNYKISRKILKVQ